MKWKLSGAETAGVVGIGLGLAWLTNKASRSIESEEGQQAAMLAGGTAIYTAGVVIGTNRPKKGWIKGY